MLQALTDSGEAVMQHKITYILSVDIDDLPANEVSLDFSQLGLPDTEGF